MTDAAPDPSLGVLLAAIQDLGARMDRGFAAVRHDIAQVRADVMAVKVDTAGLDIHVGDLHTWAERHHADPDAHGRAA